MRAGDGELPAAGVPVRQHLLEGALPIATRQGYVTNVTRRAGHPRVTTPERGRTALGSVLGASHGKWQSSFKR